MSNNSYRRRCNRCGKRVNLKIIWRDGRKILKCPNCFAEGFFVNQKKYEERKKLVI